jgi:integrase
VHLTDARQVASLELDDRPLAEKTIATYRHRGSQYLRKLREGGYEITYSGLVDLFKKLGHGWQSFEDTRARLRYHLAEEIRAHAREADRCRRAGARDGARDARRSAESLADGLEDLQRVRHRDRRKPRDHAGDRYKPTTRKRKGDRARRALGPAQRHARKRGFDDWRVDLVRSAGDSLYAPMIVQAVTGCRPGELVAGVGLEIEGDNLVAKIEGEKVSKNGYRGQPHRTVTVRRGKDPLTDELHERVAEDGGYLVATLDEPVNRYSDKVCRLACGRKRCRGGLGYIGVSPYSFRHQWSADLKAAGIDDVTLAKALGHQNTESQSTYGMGRLGRSGFSALIDAEAPIDIKERKPGKSMRDQITQRQSNTASAKTESPSPEPAPEPEPEHGPEPE